MLPERWRTPVGPDIATVPNRFALYLRDLGAPPALIAAGFLVAEAEQRGDIGVAVDEGSDADVVVDVLDLRVPMKDCLAAVPPDHPLIVRDLGSRLYLRRQHAQECRVAGYINGRLDRAFGRETPADRESPDRSGGNATEATPETIQARAAASAVATGFFVLGGGPGTGKTRTIALVREALKQLTPDRPVLIAAPTGKAAQRLRDALAAADPADGDNPLRDHVRAMTVHRLLMDTDLLGDAAAVIIDEASMLDLSLLDRLLGVLPLTTALVLVGDPGQLASVEAGRVLGDLFDALSTRDPSAQCHRLLRHNFRADLALHPLADAAHAGNAEAFRDALDSAGDRAAFDACSDRDALRSAIARRVDDAQARRLTPNRGIAFLCAHRHGVFGVDGLNDLLNSMWSTADLPGVPTLLEANAPELDLWNGDLGVLTTENGIRGFRRDALFVPESLMPKHAPGFALTIHKAQGSEFDEVVIVLPDRPSAILSRELLYTGITRARRRVTLLGAPEALAAALATPLKRSSGLHQRLIHAGNVARGASQ